MSKFYMDVQSINAQINSLNNTKNQIYNLQSRLKSEVNLLNRVEFDNINGVINEINRQYDNCELVLKRIDCLSAGVSDIVTMVTGAESKASSETKEKLDIVKDIISPTIGSIVSNIPGILEVGFEKELSKILSEDLNDLLNSKLSKTLSEKVCKILGNNVIPVGTSVVGSLITDVINGESGLKTAFDGLVSGIGAAIPSEAVGKAVLSLFSDETSQVLKDIIGVEGLGGGIISGATSWAKDIFDDFTNPEDVHSSGWELAGEIVTEGAIDMALAIGPAVLVGAVGVVGTPAILATAAVGLVADIGLKAVFGSDYKEKAADFIGQKVEDVAYWIDEKTNQVVDTISNVAQEAVGSLANTVNDIGDAVASWCNNLGFSW